MVRSRTKATEFSLVYVSSLYLDDPGERSCYSDSLRAGQSGDQILVIARLSEPFQTGY
jgi:hypothetical protein